MKDGGDLISVEPSVVLHTGFNNEILKVEVKDDAIVLCGTEVEVVVGEGDYLFYTVGVYEALSRLLKNVLMMRSYVDFDYLLDNICAIAGFEREWAKVYLKKEIDIVLNNNKGVVFKPCEVSQ